MKVLGLDEAGRGCVLGPLVLGGFLISNPDDDALRALGVNDSKRLSAARRVAVRERLNAEGLPLLREVPPQAIDAGNLNELEEALIIELVIAHRPDHVILDALGHPRTLPALERRLRAAVAPAGCRPTWHIAPKADRDQPVCGAASIVAKVHRDACLDALRARWGPLGSGYPSDPTTRAWLRAHLETGQPWPDFVRTRWGTVRDLELERPPPS